MKISTRALALVLAAATIGVGCAKVRSKAAFKDGNKEYRGENFKKAVIDYGRATELDPTFAEAWFYLGSSYHALYRPQKHEETKEWLDKAIEAYKKALETNPAQSENQKTVKRNTLAALIGIFAEDPFKNYEESHKYAQMLVAENPNDPKNLYALANLYEKFGKIDDAERIYKQVAEQNAQDAKACGALAAFYNKPNWDETGVAWVEGSDKARRSKFEQAIAILERCASIDPTDCGGYQKVASFYWDKAYRDPLLGDDQKNAYADKGLENVDKALACRADYFEAIIYKGLLYRVKAAATDDRRKKAEFLDMAAELQKQGLELKKQAAEQQAAQPAESPAAGS